VNGESSFFLKTIFSVGKSIIAVIGNWYQVVERRWVGGWSRDWQVGNCPRLSGALHK
jgi:hypothetical protein